MLGDLETTRTVKISDETIVRQQLETVRKKLPSTTGKSKSKGKGAREVLSEDARIQEDLARNCEKVFEEIAGFHQLANKARELAQSRQKQLSHSKEQPAIELTGDDWKRIRELLASDAKLSKRAKKKLLTPGKLVDYLAKLTFTPTQSGQSERLDSFLHTLGLEEIDVAGDHFCLFNAIMRWLQVNPDTVQHINRRLTGEKLFTLLIPKGVQLGRMFPNHPEMNGIAASFTVSGANYQAWGTDSMVQYLIAPWLNIPILVLSMDAIHQEGIINGVLYDQYGNANIVDENEIAESLIHDTMTLIHGGNHWHLALPSAPSHSGNRANRTDDLHCRGYTEPSCQNFQQQ